ncbi:MAG: thiopurine S-methyltransferase [Gammaproteobacteria bacterium]|nr:thiopurine S-methyltransferase [Gammaproteobacteria bacterium]
MDPNFWQQRWRDGQIGFHLESVNPLLRMYWPVLSLPSASRVLVPLCGKSHDLAWLAQQGHHVIGVELSPLAVEGFFAEQRLEPQRHTQQGFDHYSVDGIEIWCGDVFNLGPSQLGEIAAVYDRAALIALPETMRQRYVRHLFSLLGPVPAPQLLITVDYPQSLMDGPPFAVSSSEVQWLYSDRYHGVEPRVCYQSVGSNPRFVEKGLSWLIECVYLLRS